MEDKILLLIVVIISLTLLEIVAILKGIDGALFGSVIATIAGVAGYAFGKTPQIPPPTKKSKKRK